MPNGDIAAVSPLTVAADAVADFAEHGNGAPLPAERAGMKRLVALVEAIEDDPAAFWPMITRTQTLALLRAAPKTCGPWRSIGGGRWWRDGFPDAFVYSWLEPTGEPDSVNRRWFSAANRWSYDSADEAKAATDNNLRNNGYLLEDEDR